MKQLIKQLLRESISENRYENKNYENDFNSFMNNLVNQNDYDNIYISFRSSMNVSKINIKNEYNTPTGIYTYKISNFYTKKDKWDLYDFYINLLKFPFASGYPFLYFYVLKDDVNILSNLTDKSVFDDYVLKIKQIFKGNKEIEAKCDGWLNGDEEYLYTYKSVCYYFWMFLYRDILGGKKSEEHDGPIGNTNIRFTNLCNKLGIDGFNDNGEGFIHINEKKQTVFLKPSLFKTIKVFQAVSKNKLEDKVRYDVSDKISAKISPDIKNIRTIINKYGYKKGVNLIVKDLANSGDKEIKMYDTVFKDDELVKIGFVDSCVNQIKTSRYPDKLIDVLVKNGLVNNFYEINTFLKGLKMDNPLFEYIISIPKIKYYLSLKEIIKYNIKHNISLDFIYNINQGYTRQLDYMDVKLLINNADDSEKMLRFLIPVIKQMNSSGIIDIYQSINSDLGKLMFKLLDIDKKNN